MITNLFLKEYLFFIEEKKILIDKYKDSFKETLNISPNNYYDLLQVIDEIILHSLTTIKKVLEQNHLPTERDKITNIEKNIIKIENRDESSLSPTNYRIGLRQQYRAFSKLKNSAEIIKLKKTIKNNGKYEEKQVENPSDDYRIKEIFVIDYFKKMHLREDFKLYFANKFGEGSYQKFKQKFLKNEFSREILDQIIDDIRKFQENTNEKLNNNFEQI